MEKIVALIPLLPLAGFIINGLFGKKLGKTAVGYIGAGSIFISFVLTCALFFKIHDEPVHAHLFTWISFGDFTINISFLADNLSVWMMM
ncbi:MAG: NADH-quinone oxidoreductase subunit L, partial [Flavobacteriales bacterium]